MLLGAVAVLLGGGGHVCCVPVVGSGGRVSIRRVRASTPPSRPSRPSVCRSGGRCAGGVVVSLTVRAVTVMAVISIDYWRRVHGHLGKLRTSGVVVVLTMSSGH